MGLFSTWSSSPKPEDSKQKEAYEAPDRLSRAKCWDSRDTYFRCLDKNNILDAIANKEAADKACTNESQTFEQNCASSWVSWQIPPCQSKAVAWRLSTLAGLKRCNMMSVVLMTADVDRCNTSNNAGWPNTRRNSYCKGKKLKAASAGRACLRSMVQANNAGSLQKTGSVP